MKNKPTLSDRNPTKTVQSFAGGGVAKSNQQPPAWTQDPVVGFDPDAFLASQAQPDQADTATKGFMWADQPPEAPAQALQTPNFDAYMPSSVMTPQEETG